MGSKIGEAKPPRKSIKMRIALILGLCRSSPLTETTQGPISKEDVQKETEVDKIQATWSHRYHMPSEAELKTAAQLAQEGYLSTVEFLRIVDKDISEIPSDNIGKLSSIVIHEVNIDNITHSTQLDAILSSAQSAQLYLLNMSLSKENTRALVTSMTRVEGVYLNGVTLDPELLADYDGQGQCNYLAMFGDTATRYGDRFRRWAVDKGWRVGYDCIDCNSPLLVLRND